MTARRKRLLLVLLALLLLGGAAALVLSAFQKNMVFFLTPSQVQAGEAPAQRSFRVGGLVEAGSLRRAPDGNGVSFVITDLAQRLPVHYRGLLPDLFKEGKGVVAQGKLGPGLVLLADEVLAKHDENYMPPEAAYALKRAAGQANPATPPGAAK